MSRPVVSHTRSNRGDSRPLRRIRRPAGKEQSSNRSGMLSHNTSGRSTLFHQKSVDDMSDYQFSVDPSMMQSTDGSEWDCDTVGDESMYTTAPREASTGNLNAGGTTTTTSWEENKIAEANERERMMKMAGIDNSIPTNLCIGGGGPSMASIGVSKLNFNSMRSLDPTEEESQEGNQSSQEQHMDYVADSHPVQVQAIPEEEATEAGSVPSKQQHHKKSLFSQVFGCFFHSSANKKQGRDPMRASLAKTPTELWNSTDVKNNNKPKRTNTGSTIRGVSDLWAPEQAAQRGIPDAKLRMSTQGNRVWENESGRIIPFDAAEC